MKISYAVPVCIEDREIKDLLNFLTSTIDPIDEINVLVDVKNATSKVYDVLQLFKDRIVISERHFENDFSAHRNYHIEQCTGDYIFMIDADELPHEPLIVNIKQILTENKLDLLYIPRINICPGSTNKFLKRREFNENELGWINWPDFQGRIFRNSPEIRWGKKLHEKIEGAATTGSLPVEPKYALWHIKSVEKCNYQGELYDSIH